MRLYKSTFRLSSASATLWHADTIFGHLCWSLLRERGEHALQAFLELYEGGEPPVLLSDGFPGELLPRPLLSSGVAGLSELPKHERIEAQRRVKATAGTEWLSLADFNAMRQGGSPTALPLAEEILEAVRSGVTPKNQIDRVTNTAGGGAGTLYDMEEFHLPQVTLFWRIADEYIETVNRFLRDLQVSGYGKRKGIGYGRIESFTLAEFDGFIPVAEADGFVTLSRFVPAPADPTDGFWKAAVKYGKLGEEFASSGNPFKCPLIQLAAGSCFRTAQVREWYGHLIGGLSTRPEVKQYGFAFPIPLRWPAEGAQGFA
jgi:CRISPR-associated protein Csm4